MYTNTASPARLAAIATALFASCVGIASVQAVPNPKSRTSKSGKAAPAAPKTGQQIYQQKCASCHGPKGEGSKQYSKALTGTQTVTQLAGFISHSMPPGPGPKVVGEDAKKVAGYLHEAFYSPVAQARNKPARVELSHLTVRQYRNAVMDLVGTFREAPKPEERQGLRGEYFKTRRFDGNDRLVERVDPTVHFDFGKNGPAPGDFQPHTFSIRWEGSVLAPDTGQYEFIVKSEHSIQLWVNDPQEPLINASVKSGSDTEFRGTRYLVGGRTYMVRLEFTKATQGVDDTDKLKDRAVAPATISLEWQPPKRPAEVIPARCLQPTPVPERFAIETPFPPDDRSRGYEHAASVSKEWDDATTEGALTTAHYVADHLGELSPAKEGEDESAKKARLQEFLHRFAERAFRRPLAPEQAQLFVERQFQRSPDTETAVKRVVMLVLKSPRFLYREAGLNPADPYDVASRLSFGLWDSLPDEPLLQAAQAQSLATPQQVSQQAERMLADPRARAKLREFFLQWLKVEQYPDLAKNPKMYPEFDPSIAADLRTSLELTLDAAAWDGKSDYRDLLLSNQIFLNGRLAKIYGVNLPPDAPFQRVTLDPAERAGVITHPYLLASFAYLDGSSPIHRGVLIARNLLGRTLQPPPQAFTPLPASQHPDFTTRQRVAFQTKPAACAGCHNMINPLGFTLEKFDAIGRFRTMEENRPVDATGAYQPRGGKSVKFAGAKDLARYLAGSDEAHAAFVERLFHYYVKQPVRAYGPEALPKLERSFAANQFSIRQQMVETMTAAALKQ